MESRLRRRLIRRGPLQLALCLALAGCGGLPLYETPAEPVQNLGQDWRRHFTYAVDMLESDRLAQHRTVFARSAFASAARFAQDHAPSYAGLGLAELEMGNASEAQVAFLNAALIEDRSMYWALSAIAALRGGRERVARTLFDAMQAAATQDDDPASRFVRAVYLPDDATYAAPVATIPHALGAKPVQEDLVCSEDNLDDEPACRELNVVASVYFVRYYASDATTRGTGFLNDLAIQLGASPSENFLAFERTRSTTDGVNQSVRLALQPHLSIPDIQYAVRVLPINLRSSVYLNAAPSVVTSIGAESEVREGADLTILYAGTQGGDATEYTAKTGTVLNIQPERVSPDHVKLKLNFEFSSIATLEPGLNAQILNVSTNKYTVAGNFPYGRPVVLGTLSNGSQKYDNSGQVGLRSVPGIGGAFGESRDEVSTSETLVLGVLSEPAVFRGSHEARVLEAMRSMGVKTPEYDSIRRRKIVHLAPDVSGFLSGLLRQESRALVPPRPAVPADGSPPAG
ncbi:hypothetical protein [Ramlibacter sp.]|uniref:hypothetical protein n=1 Tax=Ramlibacter sp. TaxID=1917967 RepID=UPI002D5C52E3|nr:hypothetical protein [Ramlibacter sp.]HYD76491.1 hypothetical protein [Ramlibacter sp.]